MLFSLVKKVTKINLKVVVIFPNKLNCRLCHTIWFQPDSHSWKVFFMDWPPSFWGPRFKSNSIGPALGSENRGDGWRIWTVASCLCYSRRGRYYRLLVKSAHLYFHLCSLLHFPPCAHVLWFWVTITRYKCVKIFAVFSMTGEFWKNMYEKFTGIKKDAELRLTPKNW